MSIRHAVQLAQYLNLQHMTQTKSRYEENYVGLLSSIGSTAYLSFTKVQAIWTSFCTLFLSPENRWWEKIRKYLHIFTLFLLLFMFSTTHNTLSSGLKCISFHMIFCIPLNKTDQSINTSIDHTCTFQLLGIAEKELVRVLHLQVKFDCLQQNPLQHHHLLLQWGGVVKNDCSWDILWHYCDSVLHLRHYRKCCFHSF